MHQVSRYLDTDTCYKAKAEKLTFKKFESNVLPLNMKNGKWAEETEAHRCGHSSNHHHPLPN